MESLKRPDRLLALAILGLTAVWALTALSFPVPSRKLSPAAAVTIGLLALLHASVYWNADRLKARFRFAGYGAIQLAIVFGVCVSGAIFPFGLALLVAFNARNVPGQSIATGAMVTIASFGAFLLAAIATSDLYRGATAGLLLAATGVVAYTISLGIGRRSLATDLGAIATAPAAAGGVRSSNGRALQLTPRELEVLRAVAAGSRTSDVAAAMGISERTVKAHLAAIYQKLGVENRAAAITVAMRANLI